MRRLDLTGQTFSRWTVLASLPNAGRRTMWRCRCSCGTEGGIAADQLRSGKSRSCGCLMRELNAAAKTKHGASPRLGRSPEYKIWCGMLSRCHRLSSGSYAMYGARGIIVCERWRSNFRNFLDDMGVRPTSTHSIERIDSNGNYEPGNCVWATRSEQGRNKRSNRLVVMNGQTMTLVEACAQYRIPYGKAHNRLVRGWSAEEALEQCNRTAPRSWRKNRLWQRAPGFTG